MLVWESFGQGWATDATKQLKIEDCRVLTAAYGALPDLGAVRKDADVCFTWNGTTSGARVPNGDWIADDREGLTFCDATSAAFAQDLAVGEARCHHLLLAEGDGRRGRARDADPVAARGRAAGELHAAAAAAEDLPPDQGGQADRGHLRGRDDQHALDALRRRRRRRAGVDGGARRAAATRARADANAAALQAWVDRTDWVENLVAEPAARSNTSVCLRIVDPAVAGLDEAAQREFVKRMTKLLEVEGVAYDIAGYRDAPPGLRVWCGTTVDAADVEALTPWLDWAFAATAAS